MLVRPRRRPRALTIGLVLLALNGCDSGTDRLIISSTTLVGLDASINTAQYSGRVELGYDRDFVTWVPQTVQDGGGKQVMSALNCTELTVGDLLIKQFKESLATGEAAKLFAMSFGKNGGNEYFKCFVTDQQRRMAAP